VETVTIPSITARSRFAGTIPSPIPAMPWVPHWRSEMSAHSAGSAANTLMFGSSRLSVRPTPLIQPPVPCAAITASIRPSICSQTSGALDRSCASVLSGFSNSAGT
jgi:hypothetical protein